MSLESVRAFLAENAPDIAIIELENSSATVALAAAGHGVTHGQIAKTLSLRVGDRNLVVVTSGAGRLLALCSVGNSATKLLQKR